MKHCCNQGKFFFRVFIKYVRKHGDVVDVKPFFTCLPGGKSGWECSIFRLINPKYVSYNGRSVLCGLVFYLRHWGKAAAVTFFSTASCAAGRLSQESSLPSLCIAAIHASHSLHHVLIFV